MARKPGKYDHIINKLPKLPPQDQTYQDRVEQAKQRIRMCAHCDGVGRLDDATCPHCDGTGRRQLHGQLLASLYVTRREWKEQKEAELSRAELELEAVSQMLVASQDNRDPAWGAFGASDRTLKMTNGDTLRVQPEIYPVPSDKVAFRRWCYVNGLTEKMELPVKPMTDLVKSRLLYGEKEPDGITVYARTKIVYTTMKTEIMEENAQRNDDDNGNDVF